MYKIVKTDRNNSQKPSLRYSVAAGNRIICDITDDEKVAREFVDLLNENDVEEIHILDVIEDFFYS